MNKKKQNTGFICENCGIKVIPLTNGSYRNHCPECLYSKHVDIIPGDRKNKCGALMQPIGLGYNGKKGYQLIHKCSKCKKIDKNKIATDCIQEDKYLRFIRYSCNK